MKLYLLLALLAGTAIARAELRVPAFTAYLEPDSNGASVSEKSGITQWKNPRDQVCWFGDFKIPGTLSCAVTLRLPAGASSHLRLSIGTQTREVTVRGAGTEAVPASFGEFKIAKPGYQRIALESLNPSGQPFGNIDALILEGPASADAHFNLESRRNAASVHLNYTLPKEAELDAFYSEATAVEDPVHTFYMACGFQRGYFGMQVNSPTERRIIFSVWDTGAGQSAMKRDAVAEEDRTLIVAKGPGVEASAFGGEGTGGHSHLIYPWRTGQPQRFLLAAKSGEHGSAIYSGYWFHPEKKAWMLIATLQAPKASAALGHFHSFSEDFIGANGDLRRKALYGNQWVHVRGGDWREVTEASFSHDATGKVARLDRCMGVESGRFFLAHGGFVEGFTPFGQKFTRPTSGRPPADLKLPPVE